MKNRLFKLGVLGFVLVFGMTVFGCEKDEENVKDREDGEPQNYTIRYQVVTYSGGSPLQTLPDYVISYNDHNGNHIIYNISTPWEYSFSATINYGSDFNAYVEATHNNFSITAKIFVDGAVVASETNTGTVSASKTISYRYK